MQPEAEVKLMNAPVLIASLLGSSADGVFLVLQFAAFVVIGMLPACALFYVVYHFLTLPMRRNERSRLFTDILEIGLNEGRTPEEIIIRFSSNHDRSLGVRFHLLAAYLQTGLRLSEGLKRVPRLLPPRIVAILAAGEKIGDIKKVLPACRRVSADAVSQVRGAINYLLIITFGLTPISILVPLMIRVKVLPSFKQIFEGMLEGQSLPPFTRFVFDNSVLIMWAQVSMLIFLWILFVGYLGGPRLRGWMPGPLKALVDWFELKAPWRKRRLERDFTTMLALLLDSGVPEIDALDLAAKSTANKSWEMRAQRVAQMLRQGTSLPEAIKALDSASELHWRLTNALHRGRNFLQSLNGWHMFLDAKAFQLEQSAAQFFTTALVLFNGLIVASIVIGMFLPLIALINSATLW
jgi:type IV pilus assembly protein PilC